MIKQKKREEIESLLEKIENEKGIEIILAVESGSRAWGFPSVDSDYDVRILYHHPQDWYISAFQKKNVIEDIFIDDLDVNGWDVAKALNLMHKGNASLVEWLNSPIVYAKQPCKVNLIKNISVETFNPKLMFYHYISLAKKKLLDEKTCTNAKSFLYALRALLCAKWIADNHCAPPVEFSLLQAKYLSEKDLAQSTEKLLKDKESIGEGDIYPIPQVLYDFAKAEYDVLNEIIIPAKRILETAPYDNVLKRILTIY